MLRLLAWCVSCAQSGQHRFSSLVSERMPAVIAGALPVHLLASAAHVCSGGTMLLVGRREILVEKKYLFRVTPNIFRNAFLYFFS